LRSLTGCAQRYSNSSARDSATARGQRRRILERAEIGHRAMKDLRHTFALKLLTAGVQLGYVSMQLGHADVGFTTTRGGAAATSTARRSCRSWEKSRSICSRASVAKPTKSSRDSPQAKRPRWLNRLTLGRISGILERETGFEPATLSLGS
jgi:hypothetical protein